MKIFYDNGKLNKNKLRSSWVKNNLPELYEKIEYFIIDNNISDLKFSNIIYNYLNSLKEIPKCVQCNIGERRFIGFQEGYNNFCSRKCASIFSLPSLLINRKINTIKKYGVDHTSKLESVKNKQMETNISKYGFKSPTQNKTVNDKQRKSMLDRHGVEYTGNSEILMNKVFLSRSVKYKSMIDNNYPDLNISIIEEGTFNIKCDKCNGSYEIKNELLRLRYFRYKVEPCLICNPLQSYKLGSENEISKFVESLGLDLIKNDRLILDGKEIDILIKDKNVAIEFNGLYWHSELYKDKNYHIDKKLNSIKKGINLIHIWEDDWLYKEDIVKSRLINTLGLNNTKIYARKCIIKVISSKESSIFLDMNHLQGSIKSSFNIGLFYNDELVSIMTFGKFRRCLGTNSINGKWELYRFCNKLNTSVIGSFSKLLKNFENSNNPDELITYINRDWSTGDNVYVKNNFKFVSNTPINYWYFNSKEVKRKHRFNFRKDKLVREGYDKILTEKEIMYNRGFNVIWDCGSIKYSKNYI